MICENLLEIDFEVSLYTDVPLNQQLIANQLLMLLVVEREKKNSFEQIIHSIGIDIFFI